MAAAKRKASAKKKPAKKPAAKKAVKKSTAKRTTAKKAAKKVESTLPTKAIKTKQTKAQIIADLAETLDMDKKTVKAFFAALKNHAERHVKKGGSGEMTIPELGVKVKRVKKPATKKRKGRNPFTGEEIMIKAKPARTAVRATALKALKDLAG